LMSMTEAPFCGRGTYPPLVGDNHCEQGEHERSASHKADMPEQLFYLKNHII